jgi:hypothetical protein
LFTLLCFIRSNCFTCTQTNSLNYYYYYSSLNLSVMNSFTCRSWLITKFFYCYTMFEVHRLQFKHCPAKTQLILFLFSFCETPKEKKIEENFMWKSVVHCSPRRAKACDWVCVRLSACCTSLSLSLSLFPSLSLVLLCLSFSVFLFLCVNWIYYSFLFVCLFLFLFLLFSRCGIFKFVRFSSFCA